MKRKMDQSLIAWKSTPNKKPLVLFGARQTGKTTSVLDFAKREYQHLVFIDFYRQPEMKAAFTASREPQAIIMALKALLRIDITPANTLLFFDEIQGCDDAITSLKYFCTDAPEYDVIAAGSLLGVHVARKGSFPVGYVDMLTMHPMDFEEYCWALDEERSFDLARLCYRTNSPCPVHDRLTQLYRTYLLVGGMPEPVNTYAKSRDMARMAKQQSDIRTAYVADMAKYATSADAAKIIACWDSLPTQLAKESGSTKFMWKYVASGAKAERYGTAVDWLAASGIVSKCTQVSDGVSPLKSFENPGSFKIYVADTGLLANAYDASPSDFDGKDHRSARFRGGMAENYVMQQLVSTGAKPYYWGMQSVQEVEFVLKFPDGVAPIEVKSGKRVSSPSAKKFADKYNCPHVIRVTEKNYGMDEGIKSVPLYAALLIGEEAMGLTS